MHALNAVPDASVNNNSFDTTGSGALNDSRMQWGISGSRSSHRFDKGRRSL